MNFLDRRGPKWAEIGVWSGCDDPDLRLYLLIRHLNSGAAGPSIPPTVENSPMPADAPDVFVPLVHVMDENDARKAEADALMRARRTEIGGNPERGIPISVWLEDPDWRPEGWAGQYLP